MKNFVQFLLIILPAVLILSCANRAEGPTGGAKDSIPPVVVRSTPLNGSINYKKKEIQVYFNENITVDKVAENVVISPPQTVQPVIRGNARVLTVAFQDELIDSTTYSIIFGDAIVDLNEKNILKNYTFSFATGPEIDTLKIAGRLFDARNLDPLPGIIVGIHSNLEDSALLKQQFLRIGKTNDKGEFTVMNIKAGRYKLYALKDNNRDMMYQTGEAVAFHDSIHIPEVNFTEIIDTIWTDSVQVDTIITRRTIQYKPNDLVLKLFTESKKRQYLLKSERPDPRWFNLIFNDRQDSLPVVRPLNFIAETPFLLQKNSQLDSLTYWIPDSTIYQLDTIKLEVSYKKTDSIYQLVQSTDTLQLTVRRQRSQTRGAAAVVVGPLQFKSNLSSEFELYNKAILNFDEPVKSIDTALVSISEKVDTILHPIAFKWVALDSIGLRYQLDLPLKSGSSYEFTADSAAFKTIYGKVNLLTKRNFKIKLPEDYAVFSVVLENPDTLAVLEIISPQELVLYTQKAKGKEVKFEYLKPGDYFLRMYIDRNNNGQWDPGSIDSRTQPEEVFYFSKKLTLKANWELEENWNHLDPGWVNRKPEELIKTGKK